MPTLTCGTMNFMMNGKDKIQAFRQDSGGVEGNCSQMRSAVLCGRTDSTVALQEEGEEH